MKTLICFFLLYVNAFCQPHNKKIVITDENWIGNYSVSAKNKDGLVTSFDINIINLNNIALKYVSDGGNIETYKNLKSVFVQKGKIKINFNPNYREMGVIYIEKVGKEYFISGNPIYFINPGNDEMPLKRTH